MQEFLTLIDGHVHIHKNFSFERFLDAAYLNFKNNAIKISGTGNFTGVLCLTESEGINYFNEIYSESKSVNGWKLLKRNEENSLFFENSKNEKVFLIAGRQIVTKEKLEVLALGLNEEYPDGRNIEEVINFVNSKGFLPVIPWGVGKWTGNRGKIVKDLIAKNNSLLFLGDNGNRPFFWAKPDIFKKAEEKNIFNLPGSDPLPFTEEQYRPGSFGFYFEYQLNEKEPFKDLKQKVINSNSFNYFGKPETPVRFLKNQLRMQVVKHNR